jgi:Tol biopolymer transport system component
MGAMLSLDGRFVGFGTFASNLAAPDLNGAFDAVLLDRAERTFELISVASDGSQANAGGGLAAITADGRFAVFWSKSTNLDPKDTDDGGDIFLRDRQAKTTRLVSIRRGPGSSSVSISTACLSDDGRFVAFDSSDSNFPVKDENPWPDIFLVDMETEAFELISKNAAGVQSNLFSFYPQISPDGRYVAFLSAAKNWELPNPSGGMQLYVKDRQTGALRCGTIRPDGRLSVAGVSGSVYGMSADARYVAFTCKVQELVPDPSLAAYPYFGVVVRDMSTGSIEIGSLTCAGGRPNGECNNAQISRDGRFIAFTTHATNILPAIKIGAQQNVFRRDRLTNTVSIMTVSNTGEHANQPCEGGVMSGDGSTFAFWGLANNLVPGDPGFTDDVFVRACERDPVVTYCGPSRNPQGCKPHLSSDGTPSLSQGFGHVVRATHLVGQSSAMLLMGLSGPDMDPIRPGQFLCVKPPLGFTAAFPTGGSAAQACSGSIELDFNAYLAANPSFAPPAGSLVYLQAWCLDGQASTGISLSDAVAFVLTP